MLSLIFRCFNIVEIVTLNALNTQKENIDAVVDGHGDYVVPIKGNHPNFYDELKLYFDEKKCE